ncbi:MAG: glucose 1-dehydrogenase [Parvibaculum sp.]|uniref:SDR family NAD(P)-dependent oxidoreductase n=1 Tax=Parvibaculum sp. TaxID=2024848 RepID=UPI0025FE60FB|nr:glucose 1-dehydrogenase [Parvibaculum sp.]MCE9648500.1 glucose 1-dehydrogenase [Parvibaculum sp.]
MGSLQGKVALVTGASAGIGRAIALAAAREGASLVLGDVAEAGGNAVAAELKAMGAKAFFQRTDIRNRADIDRLVALSVEKLGVPDIVFANAGVEGSISAPWETSEADFTRVIDTNVTGTWRTIAAALPGMVKRGSGAIVTTASVAGLVGAGGLAAYVASKHAVVGLTKSIAIDVAKTGIRVNAICPGMIDTAMVDRLQEAVPTFRETLMVFKPMGRLGNPGEVAEAAIWLASPAASFVTGHTLAIDGGYVAQ